jgi:hypothetical protein
MAMRTHDQMICIFAPAEIEDQETIGGQQEMFLAGAHVEDVQRVGCGPSRGEKIKPLAIGAELLAFKIAELALGVAATGRSSLPSRLMRRNSSGRGSPLLFCRISELNQRTALKHSPNRVASCCHLFSLFSGHFRCLPEITCDTLAT